MSEYANVQNLEPDAPPQERWLSVLAAILIIAVSLGGLVSAAIVGAGYLAPFIPPSVEHRFFSNAVTGQAHSSPVDQYIQSLTQRLVPLAAPSWKGMVQVTYSDTPAQNAFAAPGGNITVYRGLLEQISSENALAMVLAHELAHLEHRDAVRSIARQVAISLVLGMLGIEQELASADVVVAAQAQLIDLTFSRAQEQAADELALHAIEEIYGTTQGAEEFFVRIQEQHDFEVSSFISTHPDTDSRIALIRSRAQYTGTIRNQNSLTQLPDFIPRAPENMTGATNIQR